MKIFYTMQFLEVYIKNLFLEKNDQNYSFSKKEKKLILLVIIIKYYFIQKALSIKTFIWLKGIVKTFIMFK